MVALAVYSLQVVVELLGQTVRLVIPEATVVLVQTVRA
jgi:hypothetical protein